MRTATPTARRAPAGSADDPTEDQAAELLLAFTRLARERRDSPTSRRFAALVKEGVLAPRHFHAFALVTLDGPLTVSELAERDGCALSTASLLVTQLADAGLVVRAEDPADRRRTVVSVAPAYRRESREALEAKLAPMRRALRRMGPRTARAMLEGLAVLTEETAAEAGGRSAR
jgi:DNA-binding MarR family transcriptional regulator